jgi:hypothetical protein
MGRTVGRRVGGQRVTDRSGRSGISGKSIAQACWPFRCSKAGQPLRMLANAGQVVGEVALPRVIQVHPCGGLTGLGRQRSRGSAIVA